VGRGIRDLRAECSRARHGGRRDGVNRRRIRRVLQSREHDPPRPPADLRRRVAAPAAHQLRRLESEPGLRSHGGDGAAVVLPADVLLHVEDEREARVRRRPELSVRTRGGMEEPRPVHGTLHRDESRPADAERERERGVGVHAAVQRGDRVQRPVRRGRAQQPHARDPAGRRRSAGGRREDEARFRLDTGLRLQPGAVVQARRSLAVRRVLPQQGDRGRWTPASRLRCLRTSRSRRCCASRRCGRSPAPGSRIPRGRSKAT
jgi:hypothetical protein